MYVNHGLHISKTIVLTCQRRVKSKLPYNNMALTIKCLIIRCTIAQSKTIVFLKFVS